MKLDPLSMAFRGALQTSIRKVKTVSNFGFKKASDLTLKGDRVPTGSLFLDLVLGGGYMAGSIVELMGENQVGKSFLALKGAEQVQRGVVLPSVDLILPDQVGWVDIEAQIDKKWVEKCGVDLDRFYVQDEFVNMEDCLGSMIAAANTQEYGMLVYDSVGASLPSTILAKKLEDTTVTSHLARAKLMSTASDALLQALRNRQENSQYPYNPTVAVFLNHTQQNITNAYAPDESVGGKRLRYVASTRLNMWVSNAKDNRVEVKINGDMVSVGQKVFCDVYKQRGSGAKGSRCWFTMYRRTVQIDGVPHYAGTIDRHQEIADILSATPVGEVMGVKEGNYYTINGSKKLAGVGQLLDFLREMDPEEQRELEEQIIETGKAIY